MDHQILNSDGFHGMFTVYLLNVLFPYLGHPQEEGAEVEFLEVIFMNIYDDVGGFFNTRLYGCFMTVLS